MDARESLTQTPEAQLLGLLSEALLDAPANVQALHGCAPLETENIVTDFIPPDNKIVLTYVGDPEGSPALYYVKTDAPGSRPFQMPNGQLRAGETFNVTDIRSSENGLVFGISYQGQSNGYFYANSLDNLSINVVEKTDAEGAQDQLAKIGRNINQYESFSLKAQVYQAEADLLLQAIEDLPVFDTDSPYRYWVDAALGGTLYRLNGSETPEFIAQWSSLGDIQLASEFFGNRLAVIDNKTLLIDDITDLAIGTVLVDDSRPRSVGLSYLEVVDTDSLGQSRARDNSALQQTLLESS
jgi:hypothetical protein